MFNALLRFHNAGIEILSESKNILKVIKDNLSPHLVSTNSLPYKAKIFIEKARTPIDLPAGYRKLAYYHNVQLYQSRDRKHYFVTDGFATANIYPEKGIASIHVNPILLKEPSLFTPLFFSVVLIEILRFAGIFYLHSGAVSKSGDDGILITGEGNTGKTTLTLTFIKSGYYYLGDDAIFLSHENNVVMAHAFARDFQVTRDSLKYFPDFSNIHDSGSLKLTLPANKLFNSKLADRCIPSIILFPEITSNKTTRLKKTAPSDALKKLIMSSQQVMFDHLMAKPHLNALVQLVSQCKCFDLELGKDMLIQGETTIKKLEETLCQYQK